MQHIQTYRAGLDVGSTTAKLVVIDSDGNIIFSAYQRHSTRINETAAEIITQLQQHFGEQQHKLTLTITGSAGMGISERSGLPFIQEVVAASEIVRQKYPEVRTLVDMGGEDTKMIFFSPNRPPDMRMNGSCAGGTGAFIDQMASLLNVEVKEMNTLAEKSTQLYPIASRCGVFAKTDVQNLISRNVPREDIAASVFHAVAVQTINTLARGHDIEKKLMLIGGPFAFLPSLSKAFLRIVECTNEDVVKTEHATLLSACGAALAKTDEIYLTTNEILDRINSPAKTEQTSRRLEPFFNGNAGLLEWQKNRKYIQIPRRKLKDYSGEAFIGIDSGSTTTKIVLVSSANELLYSFYSLSQGNPIGTVTKGLNQLHQEIKEAGTSITIARTAVTGYGEELMKAAFSLDEGLVETMAHFTAAKHIEPKVSFIMDIGGQDMKAIFVSHGVVNHIELNEACSSGCGSFIENFGQSLGYNAEGFANEACQSTKPFDLGTRCTVFMNSKVKQALRENATTADISAGLAYSVIKNALYKVLKLTNVDKLGKNIVVQGGTFKNPAVFRALEKLTNTAITCSDIPELMGAFGAALVAKDSYSKKATESNFVGFNKLTDTNSFQTKQTTCKGCENSCSITAYHFESGKRYFSGNKCERMVRNEGSSTTDGFNLFEFKNQLLFNRHSQAPEGALRIGIPRVLSTYESYPFWHTLLSRCGLQVELSSLSTMPLYEKGAGTIMSDSICFPAKLVHGHIMELVDRKVDRILMPMVMLESVEYEGAINGYNCPIVSSYAEVVRSAINPEEKYGIPFDKPIVNFAGKKELKKTCSTYFKQLGITSKIYDQAFEAAFTELQATKLSLQAKAKSILKQAKESGRLVMVVGGRPYHTDSLINQKMPEVLASLGCDVLTEDSLPVENSSVNGILTCTQWSYPNRLYAAAKYIAEQSSNIQFIQLNSFGCGPDALTTDECKAILEAGGKSHTLIRVDEITAIGSVRLRLRSLVESLKLNADREPKKEVRKNTAIFEKEDKQQRTILAPHFADMYSPFIPTLFRMSGYKLVNLPRPDKQSVELGLKYCNNEICYPATIIVGDVIKALQSGKYKREEVAIGITQTGGQCRASSYLGLIKKALVNAGYSDIPVISVNSGNIDMNPQPGFKLSWLKIMIPAFSAMLFADSLSKLYYATAPRENRIGESAELRDYYLNEAQAMAEKGSFKQMFKLLNEAIQRFNSVEVVEGKFPQIGIVGEIYVKYNSFGHANIVEWLISKRIEPIAPPLLEFFTAGFVNTDANVAKGLDKKSMKRIVTIMIEKLIARYVEKTNKAMKSFRYYQPMHDIRDLARKAERILDLTNQFGEGWLIPAEIAGFAEDGVSNVVSVQPFGCIANHVISKGVEKRMKDMYPKLNLLFLDFDDGAGEVNILNRLHFMASTCLEEVS